jgi:hypothetical protein
MLFSLHCLWSKGDVNRKGCCLVAWETACLPKNQGGLGIIDIEKQNDALLLKHLNSFYNQHDLPWVNLTWSKLYSNNQTPPQARCPVGSFWWKDLLKLFIPFSKLTTCEPNRGNTDLFWSGSWSPSSLKEKYPDLFSFCKKPKCSIRFFLNNELEANFSLPLTFEATEELSMLIENEFNRPWNESTVDTWSYATRNAAFSSKATYKLSIGVKEASPLFSWIWKSSTLGKHKFFFWLLLQDRLNTTNMLRRKHMHLDDYSCVLCNIGSEESTFHLFYECNFSQSCWGSISINWNLNLRPLDVMLNATEQLGSQIFREIVITACWAIWTLRNSIIFDNGHCSIAAWRR